MRPERKPLGALKTFGYSLYIGAVFAAFIGSWVLLAVLVFVVAWLL
jgi:hypothetical protein